MPQALIILEKFKTEVGTTPKGRADSGDKSGVAFAQAKSWSQSMACHHCDVKLNGVNDCPKLTHDQRKQFWEDHNKDCREKAITALREGT